MPLRAVHVRGYRSVRDVSLDLGRCTVVVGPNGCGKTNLYRALTVLAGAASGTLARSLADEGGMASVLWAGPRGSGPARVVLAVEAGPVRYELVIGLPQTSSALTRFVRDPVVKSEVVRVALGRATVTLLDRGNTSAVVRDADGRREQYPVELDPAESVLSQLQAPHRYPELAALRQRFLSWRFYHQFRTDADAPVRHAQVSVRTPALAADGRDLAAALQTIREHHTDRALDAAVARAFPGSALEILGDDAVLAVGLRAPGVLRPLAARELSDGTLRYLCLLAALLSPCPPPLLALNEPEASLHPGLFLPLAELIAAAATRSQVWLTTHAEALADAILARTDAARVCLEMVRGETRVAGRGLLGRDGDADADDDPDAPG